MKLRIRPLMTILLSLFTLLAVSGVAYALGRSRGFIKPVVDIASPTATQNVTATQMTIPTEIPTTVPFTLTPPDSTANPLVITHFKDNGDSYVLIGEFIPPSGVILSDGCCSLRLFDRNGQEIFAEMPMDIDPGTRTVNMPFAFTWARQFKKEDVTFPITVKAADIHWRSVSVPFEFDAGNNPKLGDEWQVNKSFDADGHTFTLDAVRVTSAQMPSLKAGYTFAIRFPIDSRISITLSIEGYQSGNDGFGGGGWSGQEPSQYAGIDYSLEFASLPKGLFTILFTVKISDGEQAWTVDWQP